MSRKPTKGYFVRGKFVAEGSELDLQLKAELKGTYDSTKTDLKREMDALQDLGKELTTLRSDLFKRLQLPDQLVDALAEAKRITNFEGKRRQFQYVGKLMRKLTEEQVAAVKQALDEQHNGSPSEKMSLQIAEQWRDRLVLEETALSIWLDHFPDTDVQQLRSLIRQSRKDIEKAKEQAAAAAAAASPGAEPKEISKGRAYRDLFQLVREQLANAGKAGAADAEDDTMSEPMLHDAVKIGIVSISDRASSGTYEDKGLPALKEWLSRALKNPVTFEARLIPDEQAGISAALIELVDAGCSLILTTGGTGPALRDVTPEATLAVADKEMPGFGEQMRQISLSFVPTAILSRQVAVIRDSSLIINLPGQPKAIAETLEGLKDADGQQKVNGIFAAVPYCIDLIGGPYLETHDEVCKAFRPKTAIRAPRTA